MLSIVMRDSFGPLITILDCMVPSSFKSHAEIPYTMQFEKFAFSRLVSTNRAPLRSAPEKSALLRFADRKSARTAFVSLRQAPVKIAPEKFAARISAFLRLASDRSA